MIVDSIDQPVRGARNYINTRSYSLSCDYSILECDNHECFTFQSISHDGVATHHPLRVPDPAAVPVSERGALLSHVLSPVRVARHGARGAAGVVPADFVYRSRGDGPDRGLRR